MKRTRKRPSTSAPASPIESDLTEAHMEGPVAANPDLLRQSDVIAHGSTETALWDRQKLVREIAENLREVLWIVSPDWNQVLYVSPSYAHLWGRPCEDLYLNPRSWLDAVHEEDRPEVVSKIDRVACEGLSELAPTEYRILRPDGSIRWVRARGFRVHDREGRVGRVVGIAEDISEQKKIEQALRKGKDEYQALAENLPGLVYRIHVQDRNRLQLYNQMLGPLTGFTTDELKSGDLCSLGSLIVPEDRPRVIDEVTDAVEVGRPFELNYRLRHKDGDIRYLIDQGRPSHDENGRALYIDGFVFDVTERTRKQERLREREAQLRAFFDASGVYMSLVGLESDDLIYVHPNETMAEFFGLTAAQLTGKRCRELGVSEATLAGWMEMFNESRTTGKPVTLEYVFEMQGQRHWFHGTISPIAASSSERPLFALAAVDITTRRRAEQALGESEARFREVLESSLDASYRRNLRTDHYDYMSPVFEQIGGFTPEEMTVLDTESTLELVHPEDRRAVVQELERTLAGGSGFVEYRFQTKDGSYRWLGDKIRVVTDAEGSPLYRVGVVRDITHRKEVEEALLEAKQELEERVRERTAELELRADQLARLASELTLVEQRERRRLARILHDHLQQLLVGAKFGLDVLSRRIGPKYAGTVRQVEKLLNESIKTARSLTADLSPPILHEAGLDAALEWLIRWMRENHGLVVDFKSDGKARTEHEDIRVLVFQSVREALLNIIKHAEVLRAEVALTRVDPNRLQVVVSDCGVGFPPELLDNESSVSAGFGLVSIRERLRLLGGTLEIDSGNREGTRLTLTVPIEPPPAMTASEEEEEEESGEGAARTERVGDEDNGGGRSDRIRVLLVDDHVVMRQGLSMLLGEETDIEVVGEASDGKEAVTIARELHPDVILMDFSMPGMNGVEATRIIHAERPRIRIIGLSMYAEVERADAMRDAGAVAYLSKSGRSDALLETIRQTRAK